MTSRKLPRITLDKVRSASPADRRKTVAVLGDALREHGAVRILVPDDLPFDPERAREIGVELLTLLEEYFGLPERPLASAASDQDGHGETPEAGTSLLDLHVAGASGFELERDGERIEVAARAGEWIVIAGPALVALTGGVVKGARLRASTPGAPPTVELIADPDSASNTLPEFLDA